MSEKLSHDLLLLTMYLLCQKVASIFSADLPLFLCLYETKICNN